MTQTLAMEVLIEKSGFTHTRLRELACVGRSQLYAWAKTGLTATEAAELADAAGFRASEVWQEWPEMLLAEVPQEQTFQQLSLWEA